MQTDTGVIAFAEQQAENVAGLVVAEQLPEFLLVVRHAMLAHQRNEVPLGVAGQRGLAEVRVLREEVGGLRVHVGEVAAPAARHEDFLARLVRVIDQHHLAPPVGGGECTH